MKIYLVCEAVFPENKGGLERWMAYLASELAAMGHEVTYLNSANVTLVRQKVQYLSLTKKSWTYVNGGKRSIWQSIVFSVKLRMHLQRREADLIYLVQAPIFTVLTIFALPKRIKIRFVEWIEVWPLKYWQSYLGKFRGAIGFFLQFIALQIGDKKIVFTDRCESATLLYSKNNSIKMPGLCPEGRPSTANFKIRDDIILLSRLVPEKQPLLAISVAQQMRKRGWDGNLHLVGTGPLAREISKITSIPQNNSWIHFHENATDAIVESIFQSSFMLIHPSKREGYGLSMIEAALRGVPTLLINYPDNASIDLNISPSLVCKNDSMDEICAKAFDALNNQEFFFEETQHWVRNNMPKMTARKSVQSISALAESMKLVHSKKGNKSA